MNKRIEQLPSFIANQIAAGEVIERPASVVKELLENACDSGAQDISVDIGFGGLNSITVSDNGSGIVEDDLPLAIAPHATSKIHQLEDIYRISSLGFRGEALASIGSVAVLDICSRPATQAQAMAILVEEGRWQLRSEVRMPGTTVQVRDLFYNAPVRKKFLKSARTEGQLVERVVKCFALSQPHIRIQFSEYGETQWHLLGAKTPAEREDRIRALFGKLFMDHAIPVSLEHACLSLRGWIAGEGYQRSQSDRQWIYVNGRMVQDKLLQHAIKQAYDGILHPGRYPAYVLYVDIAPDEVDVNVHPTKHELRFHQPRLVHDAITTFMRERLQKRNMSGWSKPASSLPILGREPTAGPLSTFSLPHVRGGEKNWMVLNAVNALWLHEKGPYIVDVRKAYHLFLLQQLRGSTYPLASRTLLIPFVWKDAAQYQSYLLEIQKHLEFVGITLESRQDGMTRIKTIPLCLPYLNIPDFLGAVAQQVQWTTETLQQALVQYQRFNIMQWSDTEHQNIQQFLEMQLLEQQAMCMRLLDEESCSVLFEEPCL
ncbi:MAG: DNA mismatch repair endonuclease MutL [Legionellaceae bacterium]|nr:DNA mismatch repair endonuclease MutL [Legionellaceae bacterium]